MVKHATPPMILYVSNHQEEATQSNAKKNNFPQTGKKISDNKAWTKVTSKLPKGLLKTVTTEKQGMANWSQKVPRR